VRPVSPAFVWWTVAGIVELAIAILVLAHGYWWTVFGTAPATGICAYFAYREYERMRT
jgi:uncharacterized membrane protein